MRDNYKILINGTIIWVLLKGMMIFTGYASRFAAYFHIIYTYYYH